MKPSQKSTSERSQKRPARKLSRKAIRAISASPLTAAVLARLCIWYLTLVYKTNSFAVDPPDILDQVKPLQPVIVGVWHGQHFLMPAIPIGLTASAMISRSLDGEVISRIVEHFGSRTIRASGGRNQSETLKKGGITGFLDMLRALENGDNVLQTADVPKGVARRAGLGIVMLAQRSGRPIIPLAIASSRRYVFAKSWDKTAVNLPFGKSAICAGELIHVPADADNEKLEGCRKLLEDELNNATRRAYELTGKPE